MATDLTERRPQTEIEPADLQAVARRHRWDLLPEPERRGCRFEVAR